MSLADFGDSSIRVQIVYFTADPDWDSHMAVRERVNLGILRAFAARGVALAVPDPGDPSGRAVAPSSPPGRPAS